MKQKKTIRKKAIKLNFLFKGFVNLIKRELKGFSNKELTLIFNRINFYLHSDDKKVIREYCNFKEKTNIYKE